MEAFHFLSGLVRRKQLSRCLLCINLALTPFIHDRENLEVSNEAEIVGARPAAHSDTCLPAR